MGSKQLLLVGQFLGISGEHQPQRELQDRRFNRALGGIHHDEGQFPLLLEPVSPFDQGIGPFKQHHAAVGPEVFAAEAKPVLQAAAPVAKALGCSGEHQV